MDVNTEVVSLNDVRVGMRFSDERRIRLLHVLSVVFIMDDINRIHWDPIFARQKGHRGIVAHGVLILGCVSALVGRRFVDNTMVRSITNLVFKRPICVGDRVRIDLTITDIGRRGIVGFDGDIFQLLGDSQKLAASGKFEALVPAT